MGHRPEVHGDLAPRSAQGLAAAQHERHAGPPPVVYPQRDLGKGFGAASRVDPCLVRVIWDLAFSDAARAVAGPHGVLLRGRRPHRSQAVCASLAPSKDKLYPHGNRGQAIVQPDISPVRPATGTWSQPLGLYFLLHALERLPQARLLLVRKRRPQHRPLEWLQLGEDPIGSHTAHEHEERR